VIAATYAGLAGGLLGVMQGFMPPEAFTFDTSGQLVMQTAIGGRGTLFGPLVGAVVWLYLQDFLQATLHLDAAWKLVLGLVFVLLVCFLRQGIIGGFKDLWDRLQGRHRRPAGAGEAAAPAEEAETNAAAERTAEEEQRAARQTEPAPAFGAMLLPVRAAVEFSGPILEARGLSKRYGGVAANVGIDLSVAAGELRGIIGPNGAGKTTLFRMLTCEVRPDAGRILFAGRDITGMSITDVCQLGLTKSYQVNQLFNRLTTGENVIIAALAALRGKFRLDMLRRLTRVPGLEERVENTLALVDLGARRDTPVAHLSYGEKRRLEIGLALASSPSLLLLDEPLAGMSPRERVDTVRLLKAIARGRTMVVIDHDMDAIFALAGRITVMQEGRILADGSPDEIKRAERVQKAYLGGLKGALVE